MLLEHGDHLIEDGVLFISLGLCRSILSSLVFEVRDGLVDGISGFLEDDVALGLLSESSLDLGGASVSIDLLSLVLLNEVLVFSAGRSEPCS